MALIQFWSSCVVAQWGIRRPQVAVKASFYPTRLESHLDKWKSLLYHSVVEENLICLDCLSFYFTGVYIFILNFLVSLLYRVLYIWKANGFVFILITFSSSVSQINCFGTSQSSMFSQDFAQDAQVARLLQSWRRICILPGSVLQESGDSDHRWMQRHLWWVNYIAGGFLQRRAQEPEDGLVLECNWLFTYLRSSFLEGDEIWSLLMDAGSGK